MNSETSKLYAGHILSQALSNTQLTPYLDSVEITVPNPAFGDYSTNAALALSKKLKKSPKEVAETLIAWLLKLDVEKAFSSISEKGGFINFSVSMPHLAKHALAQTKHIAIPQIGVDASGKPKKVLFEYSSPNTNKPLHIGHTRNDVYGLACIRLLKAVGYNVTTCEIINDRGIHIMKSMLMYQKYGRGQTPETETDPKYAKPDHFVGKFYTMFAKENAAYLDKTYPDFKKELEAPPEPITAIPKIPPTPLELEAQELLRKWEAGDAEVRKLWKQMNEWWSLGVNQTYKTEGSYFDEVDYESDIYDKGRDEVLSGVSKGVFQKEADGSVSVEFPEKDLGKKYLLRKDGTTIYITQDLYLWHLRNERHHPDAAMVTTASEQAYHFKVLKKLFTLLEYPWAGTFKHLPYEHVFLGKDKMSSRGGNTISADELLSLIKERVRGVMAGLEKTKENASNDVLVEAVALGAIKYGYLKYEPNTRIYFDPDQTIALEGNTGPYLQYAYARIRSIIKKAGDFTPLAPQHLSAPEEIALLRLLLHYGDRGVAESAIEYKPNALCNYLYELASAFGTFYNAVAVLATEDESLRSQRLALLLAVANVLKHGLGLLGIEAPEEM